MATITIPRKITKGEKLVVIPRKEYEKLLELEKIQEFWPTASQKKHWLKQDKIEKAAIF